jgi:hypothetical protein
MQVVTNQTPASAALVPKRPRAGRPPAKHSSPDYSQITVYVHKDVRNAVKIRLFHDGLELSALVEKLLAGWLTAKASPDLKEIP